MPNHVTTICTVTGPTADVAAFAEKHIVLRPDKDGLYFDFNTIIPRPAILEGTSANGRVDTDQKRQAFKETGFADWYDWSVANWGTKWGAYDYADRERVPGRFVFRFETAWSFPEPPFRKLAEMWPTLVLAVDSHDEGSNFGCTGEFNGKNDYRCDRNLGEDEALYLRVYGRPKPRYDENGDEIEAGQSEGADQVKP